MVGQPPTKETETSEAAEKKGNEKFADDRKNINAGGTSLFNPAMMGNVFMIIAIVLLIWIVLQFFPMI